MSPASPTLFLPWALTSLMQGISFQLSLGLKMHYFKLVAAAAAGLKRFATPTWDRPSFDSDSSMQPLIISQVLDGLWQF